MGKVYEFPQQSDKKQVDSEKPEHIKAEVLDWKSYIRQKDKDAGIEVSLEDPFTAEELVGLIQNGDLDTRMIEKLYTSGEFNHFNPPEAFKFLLKAICDYHSMSEKEDDNK